MQVQITVNFPARAGGLVAADIKGEAAGGTLVTAREKSDYKCWRKACSAGLLRVSRNTAAAGCAHIAGPFLNIRGSSFALSCKKHPHALLGPDGAGDLIISLDAHVSLSCDVLPRPMREDLCKRRPSLGRSAGVIWLAPGDRASDSIIIGGSSLSSNTRNTWGSDSKMPQM